VLELFFRELDCHIMTRHPAVLHFGGGRYHPGRRRRR
jgi:hypothetical protein